VQTAVTTLNLPLVYKAVFIGDGALGPQLSTIRAKVCVAVGWLSFAVHNHMGAEDVTEETAFDVEVLVIHGYLKVVKNIPTPQPMIAPPAPITNIANNLIINVASITSSPSIHHPMPRHHP